MWGIGYVGRLPGVSLPSWLMFILLLATLVVAGLCAGRYTQRGFRGGVYVGLLAGALNLLILGSVLHRGTPRETLLAALIWVPGSLLLSAGLAGLGAILGSTRRDPTRLSPNWPAAFGFVAAAATLLLLAVGGAVTGYDYGLAVVDWPNTAGYNMFLYPLARMTGGIYFEHSHRLFGSLVGLTTLVLAIFLHVTRRASALKIMGWIALAMVIAQGILGGLRVTGRFTLSTSPADTAPSLALAIFHGVLAQLFLACLVVIASLLTQAWVHRRHALNAPGGNTDRALSLVLIALLLVQLIFGALVRHLSWKVSYLPHGLGAQPEELVRRGTWALHGHITLAVLVTLAAITVGIRAWGLYGSSPVLRRLGSALMILVGVQVALGLIALVLVSNDSPQKLPTAPDVLVTTAHQIVGAVLLALAVATGLWSHRLLQSQTPAAAGNLRPQPARGV